MRPFPFRPSHDPERDAARYLAERAGRRWRQGFERHLLECEPCWTEVRGARRGRSLAERARELAPPELRDSIRATVASSDTSGRGRMLVATGGAAALAVVATTAALLLGRYASPDQPAAIEAAVAAYRAETSPRRPTERPSLDLSAAGLRLESSTRRHLAGLAADAYRFVAPDGRRVLVLLSDRTFPEAAGATERAGAVHGWRAVDDGVTMVCADSPVSYLVLSDVPALAVRAEAALRSQPVLSP